MALNKSRSKLLAQCTLAAAVVIAVSSCSTNEDQQIASKSLQTVGSETPPVRLVQLKQYVTVPPFVLPDDVQLKTRTQGPTIAPVTGNPQVFVDPQRVKWLATMRLGRGEVDVNNIQSGVMAIYEQQGRPAPNEIGIYGLCFSNRESIQEAIQEAPPWYQKRRSYIRKGPLLIWIWTDSDADQENAAIIVEYFKNTSFLE